MTADPARRRWAVAPYDRPPLSKEYLAEGSTRPRCASAPTSGTATATSSCSLGERAAGLDVAARELTLASGSRLAFSQLLIATGGARAALPRTERFSNVHVLRTSPTPAGCATRFVPGIRLVVIGAGFIGQEVAATARAARRDVTIVEAAAAPLAAVLGVELGGWFAGCTATRASTCTSPRASRGCTARRRSRRSSSTTAAASTATPSSSASAPSRRRAGSRAAASTTAASRSTPPDARESPASTRPATPPRIRRAHRRARTHRALGGRRPPGRRGRPRDARPRPAAAGDPELLERPARPAHPIPRPHPRRRRHHDRRRTGRTRLHRHLHPRRPPVAALLVGRPHALAGLAGCSSTATPPKGTQHDPHPPRRRVRLRRPRRLRARSPPAYSPSRTSRSSPAKAATRRSSPPPAPARPARSP